VPRRPRAQVRPLRKRTPPASTVDRPRGLGVAEIAPDLPEIEDGAEFAASPAPAPYIRRQPVVETAPRSAAPSSALPPRPTRGLVTDYGYIVSELQRTALTFGGLIVLLLVISRLLR
jgi:hypothetical protein